MAATPPPLIQALCDSFPQGNQKNPASLIETHISWVLLTNDLAYKIKKPVNLGFLDFSTLERRRFFCEEELRLNRRFAKDLYLEVTAITGDPQQPRLGGDGPVLEYAVKLKRFEQTRMADHLAREGALSPSHMDALASLLAIFHQSATRSTATDAHGLPESIQAHAMDNFKQSEVFTTHSEHRRQWETIRLWTQQEFERRHHTLAARKAQGLVRECHGDLHLGNLVLIGDTLTPFDCIEFSEDLRWIDVVSEIAFLFMDLEVAGHGPLAWRLLNRYLEITGDYEGMELFNYYRAYRAMVRAKIACLSWAQRNDADAHSHQEARFRQYLAYACGVARKPTPTLIITHGYSGSGKSRFADRLSQHLPAIRISSDVERKRLTGYAANARTGSGLSGGIYTEAISRQTYARLMDCAERILKAGHSIIADATFLRSGSRLAFRSLAEDLQARFLILDLQAPESLLRERIQQRLAQTDDPSEADLAVLDRQLATADPLTAAETAFALSIDSTCERDMDTVLHGIKERTDH